MKITVNNVNPNKLHDELIANGLTPLLVMHNRKIGDITAETTWIEFADDIEMATVQAVIDAHNQTPLPELPTVEERLKQAEDTILFLLMGGM